MHITSPGRSASRWTLVSAARGGAEQSSWTSVRSRPSRDARRGHPGNPRRLALLDGWRTNGTPWFTRAPPDPRDGVTERSARRAWTSVGPALPLGQTL